MKLSRIAGFARKETIEIVRDPVTVWISVLMPLVMLVLFGYALSFDVEEAPLVIVDHDKSVASRTLGDQFVNTSYFHLAGSTDDERSAEHELMSGRARAVLTIPAKFGDAVKNRRPAPVELLVDGTYASTAAIVSAYGRAIIYAFQSGGLDLPVQPEVRVWYNPELRTRDFVVPGLFAVILMAFPPLLAALAVAREKEIGTIAQIYASPMTRTEFIIAKLLPYAVIALLQLLLVLAAGFLWFKVPMRGSFWLLGALGLLYVVGTVSMGLLISTIVRTQVAAMLLTIVATLMPAFLFSGFVYPVFTMPRVFQVYAGMVPTTYFIDISRGIVMRGAGLADVWREAAILLGYTAAVVSGATMLVRKRVA